MADLVHQYYTSSGSTHEDLSDVVTNVSPEDTPFLSMVGKVKVESRVHLWATDTLAARTDGAAQVEGFAFSGTELTGRTRLTNYTEIRMRPVSVSESARAMNQVGTKDEFKHQLMKATKELAIFIENGLWGTSTGTVGASGTASECIAILTWITSETSTSSGDRTLTATIMNTILQGIWENGGKPDYIFCGGARKENLVDLIGTNYGQRQVPAGQGGTIVQYVDVYQNDWGTQRVVLSRDIATDTYAIIEKERWRIGWLRKPSVEPIAKRGDKKEAFVVAEYTLEARSEECNGSVADING